MDLSDTGTCRLGIDEAQLRPELFPILRVLVGAARVIAVAHDDGTGIHSACSALGVRSPINWSVTGSVPIAVLTPTVMGADGVVTSY